MRVPKQRLVWLGAGLLVVAGIALVVWLMLAPPRIDMATLAPEGSLLFVEVDSLPAVARGLTETDAWKRLSSPLGLSSQLDYSAPVAEAFGRLDIGPDDAVALGRAQVAAVVTGVEAGAATGEPGTDEAATLVVRPRFALVVKTHVRQARAQSLADARMPMLARRAYGEGVPIQTSDYSGSTISVATGPQPGRRMVWAVREDLIVIGNDEEPVRAVLDTAAGRSPSLAGDFYLGRLRREVGADRAAIFAYVSRSGLGRLIGVAPGVIAGSLTSDTDRASSVSRLFASMSEGAVQGLAYSGSFEGARFTDRYYTILAPQVADAVAAAVRPASGDPSEALALVPPDAKEVNLLRLANPGQTLDALLTAVSSRLDVGVSVTLTQIAIELRRSYGVEPEQPISPALGDNVMFVDMGDGGSVVAVFEAKDSAALLPVVERYLKRDGAHVSSETYGGFDVLRSSNGDGRAVGFVGRYVLLGTRNQLVRAIDARNQKSPAAVGIRQVLAEEPAAFLATQRRDGEAAGELLLSLSGAMRTTDGSPALLERPDVSAALDGLGPSTSRASVRDGGLFVETRSAVGNLAYLSAFL